MKAITQTGSVYEINPDSKKIRRLNGVNDPSPRMGKDGEWRSYKSIFPQEIRLNSEMIIVWGDDVELLPETKALGLSGFPTTITSKVVSIEP